MATSMSYVDTKDLDQNLAGVIEEEHDFDRDSDGSLSEKSSQNSGDENENAINPEIAQSFAHFK